MVEYLEKVDHVVEAIRAGRFYKRSGRWCSYCDFLPLCLGDQAEETLVHVAPRP